MSWLYVVKYVLAIGLAYMSWGMSWDTNLYQHFRATQRLCACKCWY